MGIFRPNVLDQKTNVFDRIHLNLTWELAKQISVNRKIAEKSFVKWMFVWNT